MQNKIMNKPVLDLPCGLCIIGVPGAPPVAGGP